MSHLQENFFKFAFLFLLMYLIRYFIMFLLFASALTKLTGAIELVELSSAFLAEPLVSFIQQSFRPNV